VNWIQENSNVGKLFAGITKGEIAASPKCRLIFRNFWKDYIPENLPKDKIAYHWFDVYDLEEGRI